MPELKDNSRELYRRLADEQVETSDERSAQLIEVANALLRAGLDVLERAIKERSISTLEGVALEPLDRAVCLAVRELFFNYVEVADLIEANSVASKQCERTMEEAAQCVDPKAYEAGGSKAGREVVAYSESIQHRVKLVKRIRAGEEIEEVLSLW